MAVFLLKDFIRNRLVTGGTGKFAKTDSTKQR
jgi:hypothetical protein